MEEVARGHEAPLAWKHGFSTHARTIHTDLEARIRSLSISRHERCPARTPCPSPAHRYLHQLQPEALIGNVIAPPRTNQLITAASNVVTSCLQPFESGPVARRSFRPTMQQINVHSSTSQSRQPLLMDKEACSMDGEWSPIVPRLDQETYAKSLRREASLTVKSPSSRVPLYSLRVVAPKRSQTPETQQRPNALHVPGSYRTEANVDASRPGHTPLKEASTENFEDYFGTIVEPSSSATAALQRLKSHGTVSPLQDSEPIPANPTLTSMALNKASPHSLSESPSIRPGVSQTAEPVLTIGMDHRHSHGGTRSGGSQDPDTSLQPPKAPSRSSSLRTINLRAEAGNDEVITPLLTTDPSPPKLLNTEDTLRLSPVSKALSILSDISSRSRPARRSSISITTGSRHRSITRPSEIQTPGSIRSTTSAAPSENQENMYSHPTTHQSERKRPLTPEAPSNLTTRTGYRQKHAAADMAQLRSWTLPTKRDLRTESTDEASILRRKEERQVFSKAILDLESLLREALTVAGRVASRENSEIAPAPANGDAAKNNGRLQSTEAMNGSIESDFSSSHDEEDHSTTEVPGTRAVRIKSDDSTRYHGHFNKARDATPYPSAMRHQSIVPTHDQEQSETGQNALEDNNVAAPEVDDQCTDVAPFNANDWASSPREPLSVKAPTKEQHSFLVRGLGEQQRRPIIQPRMSSMRLPGRRARKVNHSDHLDTVMPNGGSESDSAPYIADFKNDGLQYHPVYRDVMAGGTEQAAKPGRWGIPPREDTIASLRDKEILTARAPHERQGSRHTHQSLKSKNHLSIREPHGFSLSRSHRRAPIARDWSTGRKRFVASVTCITTALMGLVIGIYAGEVPAIQYALADEHHYTILGNVVFFIGLAATTSLLWPLPLLHGRKPYTLAALIILLPLQFPQALAVDASRSPYVSSYRVGVLLPRALSGLVMGLANINFKTTLLDLFGASLQSSNPHQEMVNENDVRRHGGGIGVWLGIWTWCSIMSIGVGFLIGAGIINGLNVSWGFWITIILNAAVLLLNVVTPEVRRSPYRRSMAEVRTGTDISRRVARGEIKMHLESTGPKYWYEEVIAGYILNARMLKQPGFLVLALYQGWIYGQVVMVIVVCCVPGHLFTLAHRIAAIGCLAFEILFLPSTVCRAGRSCNSTGSLARRAFSEGLLLQPCQAPQTAHG